MTINPPRPECQTRIFWHSERFERLDFEIRENHLVIFGYSNGQMCVQLERLKSFVEELKEIVEVWG